MLDKNQFATKLGMISQIFNSHMNNYSFDKLDATINGKKVKIYKSTLTNDDVSNILQLKHRDDKKVFKLIFPQKLHELLVSNDSIDATQ